MNNKVLVGGLIGGVAAFLLGFLIYVLAFGSMLEENMMAGMNRPDEEVQWAFLVLGNLVLGILYAWVLNKANANSLSSGLQTGAMLGFLMALSFGFTLYGVSNIYTTLTGVAIDVVAAVIMGGLVGAVIGWWYGRGRKVIVA